MNNIIEKQLKRGKMLGYPKMEVSSFFFRVNGQDQVANQHLYTKKGPYNSLMLSSLYIWVVFRPLYNPTNPGGPFITAPLVFVRIFHRPNPNFSQRRYRHRLGGRRRS